MFVFSHSSAHRNNHSRSASPESGKYRDKTPVKYKHKDKIGNIIISACIML